MRPEQEHMHVFLASVMLEYKTTYKDYHMYTNAKWLYKYTMYICAVMTDIQ